jgi:hypothetical protein
MNKNIKYLWLSLAMLFLIYAFYTFVIGLSTPVINPTLNTLADRITRTLLSITIALVIITYLKYYD